MNKTVLVPVVVPDWMNDEFVVTEGEKYFENLIEEQPERHRLESLLDDVLAKRMSVDQWAQEVGIDDVPLVRASAYKEFKATDPDQNIYGLGMPNNIDNENRPVIMRSSIYILQRKYATSNSSVTPVGYCLELVNRYMRRNHVYCFTRGDISDIIDGCASKLSGKFYCSHWLWKHLSDAKEIGHIVDGRYSAWVNGKHIRGLTEHQFHYLQRLWKIVQKTRSLDDKIEELVA